MPSVQFILADGSTRVLEADADTPVMFIAKRHEVEGILAECGGACCCATCHVHIAPEWFDRLPAMEEDERDMLEFADGVDEYSRLSCQVKLTDALDGLVVHVPESQY